MSEKAGNGSEIVLYQTEDGKTRIDVRFKRHNVRSCQTQLGKLFQKLEGMP